MTDSVAKKVTPLSEVNIKQKSKAYYYSTDNTKETKENCSEQERNLPISSEELALWINDKLATPSISTMTQTKETISKGNIENKFINEISTLAQYIITHPNEVQIMFNALPQSVKYQISQCDGK